MPILGAPLEIPAPRLMALAERLEAKAREMTVETAETKERRLGHLAQSLIMFTVALRNVADSGPRSHFEALRRFFPAQYAGGVWPEPEPLLEQRAHLDVVALLSVGDMVLADLGALVLGRERRTPGSVPWAKYMVLVDRRLARLEPASPQVRPARRLDLTLREARHRLVAHRLAAQGALFSWEQDNTLTLTLVNPQGMEEAYDLLREANARLAAPSSPPDHYEYGAWADLVEWVIIGAGSLEAEGRNLVRQAFKCGSYDLFPVAGIAEAVLELVTAAAADPIRPEPEA